MTRVAALVMIIVGGIGACRQIASIDNLTCSACGDRSAGQCNASALCVGPDMQIASEDKHTCARMQDGAVFCWGNNASGEIGDGTTNWAYAPTHANVPVAAKAVATGYEHSCIIDGAGAVWCWGNNEAGQLGRGTTSSLELDVEKVQGLPPNLTATQLALGLAHTCALMNDRTVWCWGYNLSGQVGAGNFEIGILTPTQVLNLVNVVSIASTKNHVCAMRNTPQDQLVCWGDNSNGELGDGTTTNASSPIAVHFGGLASQDGDAGDGGAPPDPIGVALGYASSCAVMSDGTVTCWGHGDRGQLGIGGKPDPTSNVYADSPLPRTVILQDGTPLLNARAVYGTSGSHACARVTNDVKPAQLYCWGGNDWGELAYGDPALVAKIIPYAQVTVIPSDVANMALGEDHGCALYTSTAASALPTVECFGDLSYLGTGVVIPQEKQAQVLPTPVAWPAP